MSRTAEWAAEQPLPEPDYVFVDKEKEVWKSAEIGEIAEALSKAQGEMRGAVKDSANPFFKSKYADLAACIEAAREPLAKHGLCVVQTNEPCTAGYIRVVTTLAHKSGQWFRSVLDLPLNKSDPQAVGSANTYGRRYGFAAMTGLAQVDDDGEKAMARSPKVVKLSDTLKTEALEASTKGSDALKEWFSGKGKSDRAAITSDPKWWNKVKADAAAA